MSGCQKIKRKDCKQVLGLFIINTQQPSPGVKASCCDKIIQRKIFSTVKKSNQLNKEHKENAVCKHCLLMIPEREKISKPCN